MRRFILLILAMATLFPSLTEAYDVLVLQGRRDPAYEEVLKGFRAARNFSQRIIILSDYAEVDIERIVREDRPGLLLAVGDSALTAARRIRQTPVVAVMAFGIRAGLSSPFNLTGISMLAPPERYCNLFQLMKVHRVGIIHNPDMTGWYLRQARQSAEKGGVELVVREVKSPRETLSQLNTLSGKVDALWMLPDSTAVTRETIEAYFKFGQEHAVPVVSFATNYLGLGAAAVVEINRSELGRQAADMAASLLSGVRLIEMPPGYPRNTSIRTNPSVLKRLGSAYTR